MSFGLVTDLGMINHLFRDYVYINYINLKENVVCMMLLYNSDENVVRLIK